MDAETLRQYLEFYQDLGFKTLYRQAAVAQASPVDGPRGRIEKPPLPDGRGTDGSSKSMELPPLAPLDDTLPKILQDIGDCRRCKLCEGRSKIVFGVGNERSPLVFVGEGPGADEDA